MGGPMAARRRFGARPLARAGRGCVLGAGGGRRRGVGPRPGGGPVSHARQGDAGRSRQVHDPRRGPLSAMRGPRDGLGLSLRRLRGAGRRSPRCAHEPVTSPGASKRDHARGPPWALGAPGRVSPGPRVRQIVTPVWSAATCRRFRTPRLAAGTRWASLPREKAATSRRTRKRPRRQPFILYFFPCVAFWTSRCASADRARSPAALRP